MTLIDAGPLLAVSDQTDRNQRHCLEAMTGLKLPVFTSLACFTEAMYLASRSGGYRGVEALWGQLQVGFVEILGLTASEMDATRNYMRLFQDVPCDLADATLLALAERTDDPSVVTLDGHFYAYRVKGRALRVIVGPHGRKER